MGGRGSSSGIASKKATSATVAASSTTLSASITQSDSSTATMFDRSGNTLADIHSMSDKDLHDYLLSVNNTDMPDFLNNTHFQKMAYDLDLNEKPEIVSDATFKKETAGKPVLYRTVNDTMLQGNVNMSATQIQQMLIDGDLTYHGKGIYGDGLYFSDNKQGSLNYGYGSSRYVECYLNSNAKTVTINQLKSQYDTWIKTHPQSRRALGAAQRYSNKSYSQFALLMGYNVIVSPQYGRENYYTILDRKVLSTTGKIKKVTD